MEHWAASGSLRATALVYGVGYRSLHRHIDLCVASILAEKEAKEYETAFRETAKLLRFYFSQMNRKPRPKSIITKPVEFTWSRRSWKKKIDGETVKKG